MRSTASQSLKLLGEGNGSVRSINLNIVDNGVSYILELMLKYCIKLLGDRLASRSFQSQVNEIHARVAVLNRFAELGRPHTPCKAVLLIS